MTIEPLTTLYIALALSIGNKAITTVHARGLSILVERLPVKDRYNCILIADNGCNSTSYYDIDAAELHQLLFVGVKASDHVWVPVRSDAALLPAVMFFSWKDFCVALLELRGKERCPICGSARRVYTQSMLRAHACLQCWKGWYVISEDNRKGTSIDILP